MPQHECTRRTPIDDDMDTSAGRGIILRGREVANVGNDGDDSNDDEQPMSPVRGHGVATTRNDDNSDDEQTTLPLRGRGRSRGRNRARGRATSHSRSSRSRGRGRGCGRGRGATPGSPTAHTPGSTNQLETVSDHWHKREPDSCTYMYNKTPGSTIPIPDDTSSLDLFCRFFTDDVWELLVTETNRYAHDHPSTKPTPRVYKNTDVDEMKAFIGMLILMGIL